VKKKDIKKNPAGTEKKYPTNSITGGGKLAKLKSTSKKTMFNITPKPQTLGKSKGGGPKKRGDHHDTFLVYAKGRVGGGHVKKAKGTLKNAKGTSEKKMHERGEKENDEPNAKHSFEKQLQKKGEQGGGENNVPRSFQHAIARTG